MSRPRKRKRRDSNPNNESTELYNKNHNISSLSSNKYQNDYDVYDKDICSKKILSSVYQEKNLFSNDELLKIENHISNLSNSASKYPQIFKKYTVDRTPLRVKYFFGEGYTYGSQMERRGPGMERLYAKDDVDDVPSWVDELLTKPLVKAGIIEDGFVNCAAINVYEPGGCIAAHIDPPHIFDRPIVSVSFFSDSALSFGCRFSYKPLRITEPIVHLPISRGCITKIFGYSADKVTHCIRPQDVQEKRAVIILRRVRSDAPRLEPRPRSPLPFNMTSPQPAYDRRSADRDSVSDVSPDSDVSPEKSIFSVSPDSEDSCKISIIDKQIIKRHRPPKRRKTT